MTKEQKNQLAILAENLKALRAETKAVNAEYIKALPVGSLKPNGKHRKAMLKSIADQESFKSVGLNEEFRLPTVEDSGWTQKQIDSLETSLENAVAKRTKLLTSQKEEIAKEVANASEIHRWKIAAPRNDGKVMKTVVFS